jgi:NAD(P)-dependent dehydrogenase (short-subunit alcohol dehydrogenase family)
VSTVLITGCSSGYGHATAQFFLNQGWNVVATMRKPDPNLFNAPAGKLLVVALDVTDDGSIKKALQAAIDAFGQIDVLINNAGIGLFSAFEITPAATTREVFETNTFGVMAVTRAIIPHMREKGAGTIVNVTSSVGIVSMPMVAVYSASKSAIEGFSESLNYELGTLGVRVKLVEPGYGPNTAFTANSMGRMNGLISAPYQEYAKYLFGMTSGGGSTTAEQVAEVAFLAATDGSDKLRYPAGPDSVQLAEARWAATDEAFLSGMRPMFVPANLPAKADVA